MSCAAVGRVLVLADPGIRRTGPCHVQIPASREELNGMRAYVMSREDEGQAFQATASAGLMVGFLAGFLGSIAFGAVLGAAAEGRWKGVLS